VTESASWDASFNGSLAAGWSNIFGIGDVNSFENFESLGPMDSWLTMSNREPPFLWMNEEHLGLLIDATRTMFIFYRYAGFHGIRG